MFNASQQTYKYLPIPLTVVTCLHFFTTKGKLLFLRNLNTAIDCPSPTIFLGEKQESFA